MDVCHPLPPPLTGAFTQTSHARTLSPQDADRRAIQAHESEDIDPMMFGWVVPAAALEGHLLTETLGAEDLLTEDRVA